VNYGKIRIDQATIVKILFWMLVGFGLPFLIIRYGWFACLGMSFVFLSSWAVLFNPFVYLSLIMSVYLSGTSLMYYSSLGDILDLLRWLFLGAASMVGVMKYIVNRERAKLDTFEKLFLMTCLAAFLSVVVSVNPLFSFFKSVTLIMLFVFLFFWYKGAVVMSLKREFLIIQILVILAIVTIAWSMWMFFFYPENCFVMGNFRGALRNANTLGRLLGILGIPSFLYMYFTAQRKILKLFWGFLLTICFIMLISTHSRAGIGAGIISSFIMLFLQRRKFIVWVVTASIVVGCFAYAYDPNIWGQSKDYIRENLIFKKRSPENFMGGRAQNWQWLVSIIRTMPLFGVGFGAYPGVSEKWNPRFSSRGGFYETGNSYLDILVQVGTLGSIPVFLLISYLLLLEFRVIKYIWFEKSDLQDLPLIAFTSIIISGLFNAIFESWMFAVGNIITIVFWLVVYTQLISMNHAFNEGRY